MKWNMLKNGSWVGAIGWLHRREIDVVDAVRGDTHMTSAKFKDFLTPSVTEYTKVTAQSNSSNLSKLQQPCNLHNPGHVRMYPRLRQHRRGGRGGRDTRRGCRRGGGRSTSTVRGTKSKWWTRWSTRSTKTSSASSKGTELHKITDPWQKDHFIALVLIVCTIYRVIRQV